MFQLWKDKEEVLRKNYLLQKSTSMYVTEDFSRKVRKHRLVLQKVFLKTLSQDFDICIVHNLD